METPLVQMPDTQAPSVAPIQATEAELAAMIVQKQQEIQSAQAQVAAPVQPVTPVVPVVPEQTQGQLPTAQPQAQNEPATANPVTFEELQKKTGVPNADVLASNFLELQREFSRKSQELAQLRKTETVPQTPPPAPVNDLERMNQEFVNDLAKNPLGTILSVMKAVAKSENQPLYEQSKETVLKNELVRLSSSPATATFNLPEVQAEIKEVIKENPDYQKNVGAHLETAYTMALGRLARKGAVVGSQTPKPVQVPPAAGFMEGRNIPSQPQPFDPKTAPLTDLERAIKQLQSQL